MRVEPRLSSDFPGLRVLELEMNGLLVKKTDSGLEALKKRITQETRSGKRNLDDIKDEPLFRAYRDFYWKVGIDPTKTRPAGEALIRRVLGGREIPIINTLVDSYNLVSLKTSIAIAAFDADQIGKDALILRGARAGETFLGIGMDQSISLGGSEVVIEDEQSRELVAVYPYRNAEKSKVKETTRDALLLMCGVPGIEDAPLEHARNLCQEFISEFCTA